jgi:hypothetical protein
MTARRADAIDAALALLQRPRLVRAARQSALPAGIVFLLEVAAGDIDALEQAAAMTRQPASKVLEAASFFIEQVLLAKRGDFYRILGAGPTASASELRSHMTLLIKYLHPDVIPNSTRDYRFDKSVYARLVLNAWDALKTEEKRAAYDLMRQKGRVRPSRKWPLQGYSRHHRGSWAR